jgi:hypothetical protein
MTAFESEVPLNHAHVQLKKMYSVTSQPHNPKICINILTDTYTISINPELFDYYIHVLTIKKVKINEEFVITMF